MTALHLLSDLRQDGVTFTTETSEVLVLTLPQGQRLHALPVPGRDWSTGLAALVQEFDDHIHLLIDCARMSSAEAEEMAWAMLLAGYTAPGSGAYH